ncbi:MAG: hypothetical protein IJK52_04030 [Oscillospiraceae bacterium]|nr:hypothetical protein [Oscillospiraceae bacterium]
MDEYRRGAERADFPASDVLETAIGEVRDAEEECPGVWYVSTYGGGERSGTEFYVVEKDADAIPAEAKAYGTAIPGCPDYLLYPMDAERQTRRKIQYEIRRHRMRESVSDGDRESLRETALDGMEECPEYFGAFPPPETTPYGHLVRYKVLMNGVFWFQTDRLETAMAVAYPVWDDVFSPYVMGRAQGDAEGFGCLFFPEEAICLAVFELGRTYRAMRECPQIDAAALMNAVYQNFPDYVLKFNLLEQSGGDRPLRWLLPDTERTLPSADVIILTPEAGTDFLRF